MIAYIKLPSLYQVHLGKMVVKISHYAEVEEFANSNDFKFTITAQKAVDEYKEQMSNIKTVNPMKNGEIK